MQCGKNLKGEDEVWYVIDYMNRLSPNTAVHISHLSPYIKYCFSQATTIDPSNDWIVYIKQV